MKVKNESDWEKVKEMNSTDGYSRCAIEFTEKWADIMEEEIAAGYALQDIAHATGHRADTMGITGFMYGLAVSLLANHWVHGEELRKWHNIDTQLGTEGEEANENGGTLNPALLNVGKKPE